MNDRTLGPPVFHHRSSGLRALDATCIGLPVGALTQVTGRHAVDVVLLIAAIRRADPTVIVLDVEYETVMKRYRSVILELQKLHDQGGPVIIRCSPPRDPLFGDFDGEEAVVRAVGAVAKIHPRPIVLSWSGQPGAGSDDEEMLELWMAMTNVVTLIEARREDEEDDVVIGSREGIEVVFDITFFDPRSGALLSGSCDASRHVRRAYRRSGLRRSR